MNPWVKTQQRARAHGAQHPGAKARRKTLRVDPMHVSGNESSGSAVSDGVRRASGVVAVQARCGIVEALVLMTDCADATDETLDQIGGVGTRSTDPIRLGLPRRAVRATRRSSDASSRRGDLRPRERQRCPDRAEHQRSARRRRLRDRTRRSRMRLSPSYRSGYLGRVACWCVIPEKRPVLSNLMAR